MPKPMPAWLPEAGTRIRAVRFDYNPVRDAIDDNLTVPPGTLGTVTGGYQGHTDTDLNQVWVNWDNGSRISLLIPQDQFEIAEEVVNA